MALDMENSFECEGAAFKGNRCAIIEASECPVNSPDQVRERSRGILKIGAAKKHHSPRCGAVGAVDIEMAGGSERALPRRCGMLSKLLIRARPVVGSSASRTATGGTDSGSVSQHPLERR